MTSRTFTFQDRGAGLEGEAACRIVGTTVHLELRLEERSFGISTYEGFFDFDGPSLDRKLRRLVVRADSPERCPSMHARRWPGRPFRWMRKGCLYLGSLRATRPHDRATGQAARRMLLFAIVPRGDTQVLEIIIEGTESSVHVPICFLEKLHQATAR